ncbi:cytidine deaminase-like [Zerene cesonia]|uniref:cytidine deaminase-like n=1 Tax=Zerene cesonia TaxID=33412 RepID=UPI0018E584A0|nr:cytidine deaminase-like [Zerene cesonia]
MSNTQVHSFTIRDFNSLSETVQNLIREAVEIRKKAYCPYSNFAVGAALITEENAQVYSGCNIENSTMAPCICAERAAITKAVCDGYLKFKTVAVVAHQQDCYTAPCGVCRQTLSEFRGSDGDIEIYLSKPTMDKVLCTKLSDILPLSFVSYKEDNVIS